MSYSVGNSRDVVGALIGLSRIAERLEAEDYDKERGGWYGQTKSDLLHTRTEIRQSLLNYFGSRGQTDKAFLLMAAAENGTLGPVIAERLERYS